MSSVTPMKFSAVMIIVQNSVVQILNVIMVNNLFQNFVHANKYSLRFKNKTLIINNFRDKLCRLRKEM